MFRIILAEDNVADVFLVRTALEHSDLRFQIDVFADGAQVFEFLDGVEQERMPRPDLMLLDLNLPKYGGIEILERLRGSERLRSTRVIIVTSSDSADDRDRAASLQVARYFRKPPDLDEFMKLGQVVQGVLGADCHCQRAQT